MNKYGTVGLAIVSGFTLGAVAVENLRAQSTAPVFIVGEIEVTDQAGYREFAAKSQAGIRAAGGQLLVIGGSPIPLIGEPPKARIVIHQWQSMDQMRKWFDSPEQTELRKEQARYAKARAFAVEGISR